MRQLNGSFEKKSLAILMRQKSEWDDTRLRSFLLLGTVWILGVRARYGQNLSIGERHHKRRGSTSIPHCRNIARSAISENLGMVRFLPGGRLPPGFLHFL
jgi:hypothetical protein